MIPIAARLAAVALAALALTPPAGAQLASREITKIVSPYGPGGARELLARTFVTEFAEAIGATVIVENRPGGGSLTGTAYVANARPDGRTLLLTGTNHNIRVLRAKNPPYDPVGSFAPIGMVATGSSMLIINAEAPFSTVPELIAYAKANPDKLYYSSAGPGSGSHMTTAYFMGLTGIRMIHVPFKSSGAATIELLAGRVQLSFVSAAATPPLLKDKRVRVLAASSPGGSKFFPDIPSVADSGVPGFDYQSWFGLLAPAGTPANVVEKLNAALNRTLGDAAVVERLAKLTLEPAITKPREFGEFLVKDRETAHRLLVTAGLIESQ